MYPNGQKSIIELNFLSPIVHLTRKGLCHTGIKILSTITTLTWRNKNQTIWSISAGKFCMLGFTYMPIFFLSEMLDSIFYNLYKYYSCLKWLCSISKQKDYSTRLDNETEKFYLLNGVCDLSLANFYDSKSIIRSKKISGEVKFLSSYAHQWISFHRCLI